MALIINEINGVIHLQGNINSTTYDSLKQYINHTLDRYRNLKIDIEKINSIDKDGFSYLKSIQTFAIKNFREIMITKGANIMNINSLQTEV